MLRYNNNPTVAPMTIFGDRELEAVVPAVDFPFYSFLDVCRETRRMGYSDYTVSTLLEIDDHYDVIRDKARDIKLVMMFPKG